MEITYNEVKKSLTESVQKTLDDFVCKNDEILGAIQKSIELTIGRVKKMEDDLGKIEEDEKVKIEEDEKVKKEEDEKVKIEEDEKVKKEKEEKVKEEEKDEKMEGKIKEEVQKALSGMQKIKTEVPQNIGGDNSDNIVQKMISDSLYCGGYD